jgi:hypothetical protein
MYVVRPQAILGTPRALAADLGGNWRSRFYPNPAYPSRVFDYNRDFLMTPVPPANVRNAPPEYIDTFNFATRNKYGQRRLLQAAGIPVPAVADSHDGARSLAGTQFVARPLRHSRGAGYRVTSDRSGFTPGEEYLSEFYPKRREYRIIFVKGEPLIYLRKKPNEGVDASQPWGHVNSRFQTINDVPGSRIGRTDAASRLSGYSVIRGAHIAAVDILYNDRERQPWVALEVNFCPALDIDNNRARVVEYILSGRSAPAPVNHERITREAQETEERNRRNIRIAEIRRELEVALARRSIVTSELGIAQREAERKQEELRYIDQERDRLERELATLTS